MNVSCFLEHFINLLNHCVLFIFSNDLREYDDGNLKRRVSFYNNSTVPYYTMAILDHLNTSELIS